MKICGSLFFIQLSKLTFGTRLEEWYWLAEPNYLPFSASSQQVSWRMRNLSWKKDVSYCKLGTPILLLLRKASWYLGFFNGRTHFKYYIISLWIQISAESLLPWVLGSGLWSLPVLNCYRGDTFKLIQRQACVQEEEIFSPSVSCAFIHCLRVCWLTLTLRSHASWELHSH